MTRRNPTPQELLDLVVANAERLRAAGTLRVKLDGIEFELLAGDPNAKPPEIEAETYEPQANDPLSDPATFGVRRAGPGSVPGFISRERLGD